MLLIPNIRDFGTMGKKKTIYNLIHFSLNAINMQLFVFVYLCLSQYVSLNGIKVFYLFHYRPFHLGFIISHQVLLVWGCWKYLVDWWNLPFSVQHDWTIFKFVYKTTYLVWIFRQFLFIPLIIAKKLC